MSKETKEKKKRQKSTPAKSLDEALEKLGVNCPSEELYTAAYTFFVHGPEGNEIAGVLLGVSYFPDQEVIQFDVSNKYWGKEEVRGIAFSFDKGIYTLVTTDEEGYLQQYAGGLAGDFLIEEATNEAREEDDTPSEEEALAAFARRKEPALVRR